MATAEVATPRGYWENAEWARTHAEEIHRQDEGDWVAVADRRVVARGADPISVRERAARLTGTTTGEVYVEFVDSADAIYGPY